ncbi:hypothetical protein B0I35DRAFT_139937 [Stachybotrys elegans]|uniref:Uncharacterized protein n=1 Tax=Stachybotrys elegans TaxID=80388 RepID=A0A8K0SZL0_9HYPO|nr:hypothetical protein B0I35DRAFT_139937 [Stachybotrys elegans]
MPSTALSTADTSCRADTPSPSPARPQFHHQITSDRLRESSRVWIPPFAMNTKIRKGRRSIFKELGLDDDRACDPSAAPHSPSPQREKRTLVQDSPPNPATERRGKDRSQETNPESPRQRQRTDSMSKPWYSRLPGTKSSRPRIATSSSAPVGAASGLHRFTMVALLIAIVIPTFGYYNGQTKVDMSGADAGVIQKRQNSPIDVCTRWAHQATALNGTLYIYGGEAKTETDQDTNTWNNNFLTLDLTRDWDIDSPRLEGLPQPDGPPRVALGYLWRDYNNLFLYGGQVSDSPRADPPPESLWKYSIANEEWTEFQNPETWAGNHSEPEGQPVHRAAEGAGISVPELGLSWYFGGHLDLATTPGWSIHTARVYLKSLLEFTHPGYVNSGVDRLSDGSGAADAGAFRNITAGGVQDGDFPERADGVLVYIPGWGHDGVLIGMAGGTNDTYSRDLGTLSVYDIANSEWYHQPTQGDVPGVRVNPCAVVATVPDASSFQVYLFGGQTLLPYEEQDQYDDMYILTIPSFTWIKVDQSGQDVPYPRAGHTCTLQDAQMIVVGGYVGEDVDCDSPGIYVFDVSSLEWLDRFTAADHEPNYSTGNSVLDSSYGYRVPRVVRDEIGGDEDGGATVTAPAGSQPTEGPFATGRAPVFTVTAGGPGSTQTVTNIGPGRTTAPDSSDGNNSDDGGPSAGLIAAAAIAGALGALALYLGFCAWLYRRQVSAYKQHIATANRYGASNHSFGAAMLFGGRRHSSRRARQPQDEPAHWGYSATVTSGGQEPDWLSEEPKWAASAADDQPSSSSATAPGSAHRSDKEMRPRTSGSGESTEGLLDGREPSFFSVVMGPRRALRVVNGID